MFESRKTTFTVWIAGAVLLLTVVAAPAWAGQRVALVVGNAAYAHAPALATPLNDASDVGEALERLEFAVTRVENADQAALLRRLRAFATAAEAAETAVVFYAGHGVAVDGRNFLLPVDARLASERDIEFEAVPLALAERAVARAAKVRVIVLDASRENPFVSSMGEAEAMRSIGRGLARLKPSTGTLVASAATEGTLALDGQGPNSLYGKTLLRYLEEPGLEVGAMFDKVREAVLAATGGSQEPTVYGSLLSASAYLGPSPSSTESQAATQEAAGEGAPDRLTAEMLAAERLYWDSVKDSSDPAEIRTYLDRYPNGTYAALARVRVGRLKREAGATAASAGSGAETPAGTAETGPALEPEAAEKALGLRRDDRRLIQSGLTALGFDPGPVDGVFGRGTRAAIGKWQTAEGRPDTGYLDVAAARALAKAGAAAPPLAADTRKAQARLTKAAAATLSNALETAGKIDDAEERADAFADIGEVFAEANEMRRAMQAFDLAMTTAEGVPAGEYLGVYMKTALSTVVAGQAKVGDARWGARTMARVMGIARRLGDLDDRAGALAAIARAQARSGDAGGAAQSIAQALAAAARIEDQDDRSGALLDVAHAQGGAHDFRAALATASRIRKGLYRVWALTGIARAQTEAGEVHGALRSIGQALAVAERMEDEGDRSWALESIAEAQAGAGDAGGAARSIERALATAQRIETEYSRNDRLIGIAKAQAKTGDIPGALSTTRLLKAESRAPALVEIAKAQAKTGDIPGALSTTSQLDAEWARVSALSAIAETQKEAGDAKGAARSIEQALAAAARIEEGRRDLPLFSIALVQASAGSFQGALATAQRIKDEHLRASSFVSIARAQVKGAP